MPLGVQHACVRCGRRLPVRMRIDAKYCSDRCRAAAHREVIREARIQIVRMEMHLAAQAGEASLPRCQYCGISMSRFTYARSGVRGIYRPDRRYCSGRWRTAAYRARKSRMRSRH